MEDDVALRQVRTAVKTSDARRLALLLGKFMYSLLSEVLPAPFSAFGSPDSAKMADLIVTAFTGSQPTALKGSQVLFIGKPADNERVKAAVDVFKEKLIRRDISMKAFDAGDPQASGKTYKVSGQIKQGISSKQAKKITKLIRDDGPKGVKAQIQGDELRVSSKKRDDLQAVIALVKAQDYDFAVQFTNYR